MVERSRRSAGISIRAMSLVGQPGLFIAADPGLLSSGVTNRQRSSSVASEILAELHAPSSNLDRAARQSRSVLICSRLALAPSFLQAICLQFGIAKFAVIVLPRYQQKYQQNGRLR